MNNQSSNSVSHRVSLKSVVSPLSSTTTPVIRHAIVEALGVEFMKIEGENLSKNVDLLVERMGFHAVNSFAHKFEPQGISYVVVLEESHIAIHTWPEKGYIHMDIVTCTAEDMDIKKLEEEVKSIFQTLDFRVIKLDY